MNVLIVLAHPEHRSFNAAMARVAEETLSELGHHVVTTDLYPMEFEASSDRRNFVTVANSDKYDQQDEEAFAAEHHGFVGTINREIDRIKAADLIIWQFPLWWFGPPAVLKGYIDRVLAYKVFYGGGQRYETGVLAGKRGLLSLTTGAPESHFTEDGIDGPMSESLAPLIRTMRFVGLEALEPQVVYEVRSEMTTEEAEAALAAYRLRLQSL